MLIPPQAMAVASPLAEKRGNPLAAMMAGRKASHGPQLPVPSFFLCSITEAGGGGGGGGEEVRKGAGHFNTTQTNDTRVAQLTVINLVS
eukprot:COSAG06_NODE_291_length_18216_cov_13.929514_13_plen_89_part_00